MANTISIEQAEKVIKKNIIPNGTRLITGQLLQDTLLSMTSGIKTEIGDKVDEANTMAQHAIDIAASARTEVRKTAIDLRNEMEINFHAFDVQYHTDMSALTQSIEERWSEFEEENDRALSAFTEDVNGRIQAIREDLDNYMVTTPHITDSAVTYEKLDLDVSHRLLTDDMLTFLDNQIRALLQEEANSLFFLVPDSMSGNKVYWEDETNPDDINNVVSVGLQFNGNPVESQSTPEGWRVEGLDSGNPIYRFTLDKNVSSVPATRFSYKPTSGRYMGLTVERNSTPRSYTFNSPAWYGLCDTDNFDDVENVLNSKVLRRITSPKVGVKETFKNETDTNKFLWIISKSGDVKATQLGIFDVIEKRYNLDAFTSPNNSEVQLENYHLYISTQLDAYIGEMTDVELTIPLS